MSFLAGRLASMEGAYFLQESRLAVDRLIQKNKKNYPSPSSPSSSSPPLNSSSSSSSSSLVLEEESKADVLPEILRHSLPSKILKQPLSDSTLERPSVWVLPQDPNQRVSVSIDVINPLRSYLALPQVTFGPKRWQLPEGEHSVLASTANELRTDRYTTATPENLKAAAAGLSQIGGAFAVATAVVFGGAALTFGLVVSKLELQNGDDIRNKARDLFHPKFEGIEEQLVPLRVWAQNTSKKWRTEREEIVKENRLVKELSKRMVVKTPN